MCQTLADSSFGCPTGGRLLPVNCEQSNQATGTVISDIHKCKYRFRIKYRNRLFRNFVRTALKYRKSFVTYFENLPVPVPVLILVPVPVLEPQFVPVSVACIYHLSHVPVHRSKDKYRSQDRELEAQAGAQFNYSCNCLLPSWL